LTQERWSNVEADVAWQAFPAEITPKTHNNCG